ncbi:MAG: DoxX family protein [Candidatus Binataceae bacterium]|nr:DoxX family protein [Candidatus Binataceae bacterium]
MDGSRNLIALAGRFLLALIFVLSGFQKLTSPSGAIGYITHGGIPHALIYPALVASILVELGLGLLLMVGFKARWAAILMFLWFIPVTIMFHFLPYREAVAQGQTMMAMMQQINFMKNISIMGGLLLIAAFGSGTYSLDGGK